MNIPLWKLLEVGSWAVSLVAVVGFFWLVRRETAKARLIVEAAAARVGGSPTASGFVGTVRGVPVELAFHSSRSGGYYVGTIEAPTGTPVYSVRPRGWFTGLGGMDVIDGIFGLHARDRPRAREAWTPALEAAFVDLVQPRRGALAWVEGGVECDGRLIHIRSLSRGDLERMYNLYIRAFEVVAAAHSRSRVGPDIDGHLVLRDPQQQPAEREARDAPRHHPEQGGVARRLG
jgi:plasmid stabilization system protein ParE